ncbi:PREDICTED: N-acetyl-beta-glucosaminyl-glycoprotein 4-beta-N-acetylgalactosaminyltransferase 1-like [Amphimedon queenslandica]|uniref:Hexosyltransferase n=1 Tax=Amphimedon queenslandica TaxID=400682 RepID=A0AAN0K4W4_AMPQE|nr:PREDICTED: N-acetyl-beta-glucosaminyl-glycoprotein 4-beta-N-acetylgalactosaminyltransferase 1-like [Amphimedon queenslandica]|eukprot:XP_019864255.1 PREDICTED: N-acetyl-beta-glucosaminyl-glycoprotein 4-beta-N-acetylgalactosaminyltransferase 1-like [Amphimedon queenslandica]
MARITFRKLALVFVSLISLAAIFSLHTSLWSRSSSRSNGVISRGTPINSLSSSLSPVRTRSVNKTGVSFHQQNELKPVAVPMGMINYDEWTCPPFVGYFVDDLRMHRYDWPEKPTVRMSSRAVRVITGHIYHFGARLYGYLHPPVTGLYWFSVNSSLSEGAYSIELWISRSSDPTKLVKRFNVTYAIEEKNCSKITNPIFIKLANQFIYYFEFHVKSFKAVLDIGVQEPIEHYKGYYKVRESGIFPWDENKYVYNNKERFGNRRITESVAQSVLLLYRKEFSKFYTNRKVKGIHYLVETKDQSYGSRFLLEMDIQLENGDTMQTSEYVYLPNKKRGRLCHTLNFQWKRNINVYIVVSVKDLGEWIKHLIHNMVDIYHATNDKHFQLVIVDYSSDDIDITKELLESSLPHWKVISLEGPFSRSAGLQAGVDYASDNNSIVMTIDMHLTLPLDFIDSVRKHTIEGKMAYAPMFFKLSEGFSENNVDGYWQIGTFGLFGMFKSDWERVGGFDVINYKYRWGGEDWDLLDRVVSIGIEVFRVRPPGLFHYYHTRAGMWGFHGNKLSC